MESFRSCEECNEVFEPRAFGKPQKFCSPKCRQRFKARKFRAENPDYYKQERYSRAKPKLPERGCENCGRNFQPIRENHRFCGAECSNMGLLAARKKLSLCWECGTEFAPATPTVRYCDSCRDRDYRERFEKASNFRKFELETKACGNCAKSFVPRSAHQQFCSKLCAGAARRNRQSRRIDLASFQARCNHCGIEFQKKVSNQRFCSVRCRNSDQLKRPVYLDRRLWDSYRLRLADVNRQLEKQENACPICRLEFDETQGRRWVVDHDHSCCPEVPACGRCNRGLICAHCNVAIGLGGDNPKVLAASAKYLERGPMPDRSSTIKPCEVCGKDFSPYRSTSLYCSKACQKLANRKGARPERKLVEGTCINCGKNYTQRHPSQLYCGRDCSGSSWAKHNRFKRFWTNYRLPETVAIEIVNNQSGKCELCGQAFSNIGNSRPHLDHDHSCCPKIPTCGACNRGIVCGTCNFMLAKAKDNPDTFRRAVVYLEREDRLVSEALPPDPLKSS